MGCQCDKCQNACHTPGWFTPEEAYLAINAGYAKQMMLDWYTKDGKNIYVLSPASKGCRQSRAPNTDELFGDDWLRSIFAPPPEKGQCVLQDKQGNCLIHNTNFKPKQCRDCMACEDKGTSNKEMVTYWDNEIGKQAIEFWMNLVNFDKKELKECT